MLKLTMLLAITILTWSCTDASMAKKMNLGNSASVRCYSGGVLIFEGRSTGKVMSEKNSDGYFFKDASDNRLKEVSGNCVIVYDK